jgi:hypothetical protein
MRPPVWLSITAAIVAGALSLTTPASAHSGGQRPSAAELAHALAHRVLGATNERSRYQALLAVARAIDLGVYTSHGRAILRGSEASGRDIYLYDFELKGIASALGRGDTIPGVQLASQLRAVVGELGGQGMIKPQTPPSDERVAAVLAQGARAALRDPNAPQSLVPLLVRDLGLLHSSSFDLARGVDLAGVEFDALQQTLILREIIGPIVHAVALAARHDVRRAGDISVEAHSAGVCDFGNGGAPGKFTKWVAGLAPDAWKALRGVESATLKKLGNAVKLAVLLTDFYHDGELALTLEFRPTVNGQIDSTAYGPPGNPHTTPGEAGRRLQFQVGLVEDVHEPDAVVKCGALLGLKFPPQGPVNDVPVSWRDILSSNVPGVGGYAALVRHGTVVREDTKTGQGGPGVATLIFQPKDEMYPGLGQLRNETGTLVVSAAPLTAFGSSTTGPALEAANLFNPRFVKLPWLVQHHEHPNVFDVTFSGQGTYSRQDGRSATDGGILKTSWNYSWSQSWLTTVIPRDGSTPNPFFLQTAAPVPQGSVSGTIASDFTDQPPHAQSVYWHCTAPIANGGGSMTISSLADQYEFAMDPAFSLVPVPRVPCPNSNPTVPFLPSGDAYIDISQPPGLPAPPVLQPARARAFKGDITVPVTTLNSQDEIDLPVGPNTPLPACEHFDWMIPPCTQSLSWSGKVHLHRVTPDEWKARHPLPPHPPQSP